MCMMSDGEWTLYSSTEPKARIEHRCGECGRTIQPGERYTRWDGMMDCYWSSGKACGHCMAAGRWLTVVCGGWIWDVMREDLREHVDGYESELRTAPLTRLARWWEAGWMRPDGTLRPLADVDAQATLAIEAHRAKHPTAVSA